MIKKVNNYSNDVKKICNVFILGIFILSNIFLVKYSTLPIWVNIDFFIRPENPSEIMISLYTSFVVTTVFYFFINYIPDREKEYKAFMVIKNDLRFIYTCMSEIVSAMSLIASIPDDDDNLKKDEKTKFRHLKIKNESNLYKEFHYNKNGNLKNEPDKFVDDKNLYLILKRNSEYILKHVKIIKETPIFNFTEIRLIQIISDIDSSALLKRLSEINESSVVENLGDRAIIIEDAFDEFMSVYLNLKKFKFDILSVKYQRVTSKED